MAVARPRRRWGRIIGRIFLVLILLLVFGLLCSAGYNRWAFHHYRSLYAAPGKIIQVDGYNMHLYCTGSGGPTVVLDAGLGNDALIWGLVQPQLSKLTRVCSYDRAGFGWSDPRPGVRDSNAIADQLHGLLTAGGISGPIILMGHSIAGLHMRAYAAKYRESIAGIVFVDGSTPEQLERMPPEIKALQNRVAQQLRTAKILMTIGLPRIMGQCGATPPKGMEAYANWYKADNACNPPTIAAVEGEFRGIEPSAAEVMHTGPFGDLPILIFSQDPDTKQPGLSEQARLKMSKVWYELQDGLKRLSTRSRRIIARGSSHYVQIDRAELLNSKVPEFIRQIRGEAPQPADYGSTKTE